MLYRISLFIMAGFYVLAGLNHFRAPQFYVRMIPPKFPRPRLLNALSGLAEIILGVTLFRARTQVVGCLGNRRALDRGFSRTYFYAPKPPAIRHAPLGALGTTRSAGRTDRMGLRLHAMTER